MQEATKKKLSWGVMVKQKLDFFSTADQVDQFVLELRGHYVPGVKSVQAILF